MKRVDNWPELLDEAILKYRDKPFIWGQADCCLFPADAVLAMTGIDCAEKFRGTYNSEGTAYKSLRRVTGKVHLIDAITVLMKMYNFQEKPVEKAQRGDVLIVEADLGMSLGLMGLNSVPLAMGYKGIVQVSQDALRKAWSSM